MRRLMAVGLVLAWASLAMAAPKTIADIMLPCNPYYHVLSPDGTQLAVHCQGSEIHVLSVPAGKELASIPRERKANAVTYSPDGKWLAVGFGDGTVDLFPTAASGSAKSWKAGPRRIDQLYFFPDGKTLVVGPADEAARVWALGDTEKLLATLPFEFGGMNAAAVSPDGKTLVIAGDDTAVRFYDTTTWKKTSENREFLLESFALSYTPDGKQVLVGGADARITVLDAATAKRVRQAAPEDGYYIVELALQDKASRAAAIYVDDTGHKPAVARVWELGSAKSEALETHGTITGVNVVNGKLWVGSQQDKKLTLAEYE